MRYLIFEISLNISIKVNHYFLFYDILCYIVVEQRTRKKNKNVHSKFWTKWKDTRKHWSAGFSASMNQ
jgi:hypothetical protein